MQYHNNRAGRGQDWDCIKCKYAQVLVRASAHNRERGLDIQNLEGLSPLTPS